MIPSPGGAKRWAIIIDSKRCWRRNPAWAFQSPLRGTLGEQFGVTPWPQPWLSHSLVGDLSQVIGLEGGETYNALNAKKITASMAVIAHETGKDFQLLAKSLDSLPKGALDNCIALDLLLASQGGVCAMADNSCCFYIKTTGQIKESTRKIMEHSNWLQTFSQQGIENTMWDSIQNMLPKLTWFFLLLCLLTATLLLLLFGPRILNYLVHFVSVKIQATRLQMAMQECRSLPLADGSSNLLVVQGNLVLSYLNLSRTASKRLRPIGLRPLAAGRSYRSQTIALQLPKSFWVPVS